MYLKHFGLVEYPFGITPDTSFVYATTGHQEALNTLLVALRAGEGFVKITGEVGTGKTLLCRRLLQNLGDKFVTAYLPNPNLEPRTLYLALAEELRLKVAPDIDQYHLLKSLNKRLLDIAREGKSTVVCIDEAQAMPLESLEALRLLSNLETENANCCSGSSWGGRSWTKNWACRKSGNCDSGSPSITACPDWGVARWRPTWPTACGWPVIGAKSCFPPAPSRGCTAPAAVRPA